MDRRAFIASVGAGILIAPLVGEAQQAGKVPRIGYLSPSSLSPRTQRFREAFRQGLSELG
jgi:putative ABC transport system substrate-binding protein